MIVGGCIGCVQNDQGYCRKLNKWAYLIPNCETPELTGMLIEHVNTGTLYRSLSECAEKTNTNYQTVKEIVWGKRANTKDGKVFRKVWVNEKGMKIDRRVRHVESGKLFDSTKEAAKEFKTSSENVLSAIRRKGIAKGQHFEWVEV